jgi:3-oxoacyl-[acyl-carrier-protein] synthase II
MAHNRVCITGIGVMSPLGDSVEELNENLFAGRSSISVTNVMDFSVPAARHTGNDTGDLGLCDVVGAPRTVRMAVAAARRALHHAGLVNHVFDRKRAGVFVGVGNAPIDVVFDNFSALHNTGRVGPMTLLRALPSGPASFVAIDQNFQGACHCYTTACASGMMAISQASHQIASGRVDIAIAGGSDAPLDWGTVAAWKALRVLAPIDAADASRSCRPFASKRGGVVLGEGAAMFILESEASARARGANILAIIAGTGESCDAHHITKPEVDGQLCCMSEALVSADLQPADVDLVVAHGTGTIVGDIVETKSLRELLKKHADNIMVVANKALIGHTLGAAGAFNLCSAIMAVHNDKISGTYHLDEVDENCNLNYLANSSLSTGNINNVLVNTFGFGGINACLLVSRFQ